jgi:hypothetical protein
MALIKTTRSSARFVLELLDDIKAHILAEPKFANMATFCKLTVNGLPSCQTTGCFAGWAIMLAGLNTKKVNAYSYIGATAEKLLGSDLNYTFGRGGSQHFFNSGAGDSILRYRPGTNAYAKAMARRIDRFIRLNGGRKALATRPLDAEILAKFR